MTRTKTAYSGDPGRVRDADLVTDGKGDGAHGDGGKPRCHRLGQTLVGRGVPSFVYQGSHRRDACATGAD